MKIRSGLPLLFLALLFTQCKSQNTEETRAEDETAQAGVFEDITVAQARTLIGENTNLVILDVRTPEEIAEGKIDGALEIDINGDGFGEAMAKLDPKADYLVYCRSGGRSARAMEFMKNAGFTSVKNMLGGYTEWSGQ